MKIIDVPFYTTDWSAIEATEYNGVTGKAIWRKIETGTIRIRMVEYTSGYLADHWCSRGHVLFVLEGELQTELQDGRTFVLTPGMSYQVADGIDPHRSSTLTGVKLFIVD
jgi:quercetin dioxygenase-like cupin family protein